MGKLLKLEEFLNENTNRANRKEEAMKTAKLAKDAYKTKDMKTASEQWCKIYDLYEDDKTLDGFIEMQEVMSTFTDDEVYGITDYMKKHMK